MEERGMIGKLIGAAVGAKAAQHARGVNGPAGALLGMGAVAVARRMGPLGWVAAAAGGYALKRYNDKREAQQATRRRTP
jgi:hypothetical protein